MRLLATVVLLVSVAPTAVAGEASWTAGAAREDITPPAALPMWGYGGRKDLPCRGVRTPLTASAVVIGAGETRIAIVGLDLGRSPARSTHEWIRREARARADVDEIFLVGSHTHNGPCIEIETVEPTAAYVRLLRERIVRAIARAASGLRPARVGAAARRVDLNRNRHSDIEPKPVDDLLQVMRIDGVDGRPIATLVNFAAHPTTIPATVLEWAADYPASLRAAVEDELGGTCVFLQGASGDLSTDRRGLDTGAFGRKLGRVATELARGIETTAPRSPQILLRAEEFRFASRIDLEHPLTYLKYTLAFFPALTDAYRSEYSGGIRPNITLALLDGRIALVGASGEFFCQHAIRLRERARLPHVLFLGYCNGYHQYFPTIEAVAEGGYGADREVSPVEVGAGERMMDRALFHLFDMRKPIAVGEPPARARPAPAEPRRESP